VVAGLEGDLPDVVAVGADARHLEVVVGDPLVHLGVVVLLQPLEGLLGAHAVVEAARRVASRDEQGAQQGQATEEGGHLPVLALANSDDAADDDDETQGDSAEVHDPQRDSLIPKK